MSEPISMAKVTIEKELFDEVINCKLRQSVDRINAILAKWKYSSEVDFLNDARTGKIEEAESDAISLTNLLDKRAELFGYQEKWSHLNECQR